MWLYDVLKKVYIGGMVPHFAQRR